MKAINSFLIAMISIALISCDDIIEDDISNDTIQMVSPLNGATIESNVAAFQWNPLDGADDYRIQVYSANQSVVLDSTVTSTRFTYPLPQGTYQWRVRGENSAYESSYSFPMGFTMVATTDLTNQQVILSSPDNNLYFKTNAMICTWQELTAADYYKFELVNLSLGGVVVLQETDITNTAFTLTESHLANDAQYQWKVQAVNTTGNTLFSSRTFYIDTAIPNASINTFPANDAVLIASQQTNFTWSVASDNGTVQSPVTYIVEFSNDSAFASILLTSPILTTNTFQNVFSATGDYYWRVRTKDLAGNESANSAPFKFRIN